MNLHSYRAYEYNIKKVLEYDLKYVRMIYISGHTQVLPGKNFRVKEPKKNFFNFLKMKFVISKYFFDSF